MRAKHDEATANCIAKKQDICLTDHTTRILYVYISLYLTSKNNIHIVLFFFLNDRAPPEIYPLPLPDALPIYGRGEGVPVGAGVRQDEVFAARLAHEPRVPSVAREALAYPLPKRLEHLRRACEMDAGETDRKSTRLNSSHLVISYAAFCLKTKHWTPGGRPPADTAICRNARSEFTPYELSELDLPLHDRESQRRKRLKRHPAPYQPHSHEY